MLDLFLFALPHLIASLAFWVATFVLVAVAVAVPVTTWASSRIRQPRASGAPLNTMRQHMGSAAWRFRSAALVGALIAGGALAAHTQTPAKPAMSISGRIVSAATGRPIPGARVNMNVSDAILGAAVNADGAFQVQTTVPGRYRVWASAPGYRTRWFGEELEIGDTAVAVQDGRDVRDIDIALHRGATIAGIVTDDVKEPLVSGTIRAFARRVRYGEIRFEPAGETRTDDRGMYRLTGLPPGQYLVGLVEGPLATFAPSAVTASAAMSVTLAEDAERNGVNIQTRAVKVGTVEGTIGGPALGPSPSRVTVQLVPDPNVTTLAPLGAQAIGGRFGFNEVPAGRYHLIVRPGLNSAPSGAWAVTPIVVSAGKMTPATVTVSDEPRMSGTIESVGLRGLSITLTPIGSDRPEASPNWLNAPAQGPFTIAAVPPGRYHLEARINEQTNVLLPFKRPRVVDPGVHRLISSIFVKGEDVTDRVLLVAPKTSVEGVRVVVTETGARITGTVLDAAGKPTAAGAVVVVASEPQYWTVVSRRIRVTRADTDGVFHVPLLPPGRYRVAHVMRLAPGQLWDPAFLKTLGAAQEVTAPAGEVSTVQLRLK
jgi:hypothetical protein